MKFVTFSLKERPFNKIAIKPEDIYSVTEVAETFNNVTYVYILIKKNDKFEKIPVAGTFSEVVEILNSGDTDGR